MTWQHISLLDNVCSWRQKHCDCRLLRVIVANEQRTQIGPWCSRDGVETARPPLAWCRSSESKSRVWVACRRHLRRGLFFSSRRDQRPSSDRDPDARYATKWASSHHVHARRIALLTGSPGGVECQESASPLNWSRRPNFRSCPDARLARLSLHNNHTNRAPRFLDQPSFLQLRAASCIPIIDF